MLKRLLSYLRRFFSNSDGIEIRGGEWVRDTEAPVDSARPLPAPEDQ